MAMRPSWIPVPAFAGTSFHGNDEGIAGGTGILPGILVRGQTMISPVNQPRTCQSAGPWHAEPILIESWVPLTWAPGQCCLYSTVDFTVQKRPNIIL